MELNELNRVKQAFNQQANRFDEIHYDNPVVTYFRKVLYRHIIKYVDTEARLLDLGGGTGIDAIHLARKGYRTHVIDLSQQMIKNLSSKVEKLELNEFITFENLSFTQIDRVEGTYDLIFSNFGAINCIPTLIPVISKLDKLLRTGGYVIFVYMSTFSPWELVHLPKDPEFALRRIEGSIQKGIISEIDGSEFMTYYFPSNLNKLFSKYNLKLIKQKSLGLFVPPPFMDYFVKRFRRISNILLFIEQYISHKFPFNRLGDMIMSIFQYNPVDR